MISLDKTIDVNKVSNKNSALSNKQITHEHTRIGKLIEIYFSVGFSFN